jgi:hypothetical protein
MRALIKSLRHHIRYAFDADYRIECIADAVERRLQPQIGAEVRGELDRVADRVSATMSASFAD